MCMMDYCDDMVTMLSTSDPKARKPHRCNECRRAADAFWGYWRENGETHRHGHYESTWGAINRALRTVGVVPWIPLSERPKTVGASTGAKSENQPDKS